MDHRLGWTAWWVAFLRLLGRSNFRWELRRLTAQSGFELHGLEKNQAWIHLHHNREERLILARDLPPFTHLSTRPWLELPKSYARRLEQHLQPRNELIAPLQWIVQECELITVLNLICRVQLSPLTAPAFQARCVQLVLEVEAMENFIACQGIPHRYF